MFCCCTCKIRVLHANDLCPLVTALTAQQELLVTAHQSQLQAGHAVGVLTWQRAGGACVKVPQPDVPVVMAWYGGRWWHIISGCQTRT